MDRSALVRFLGFRAAVLQGDPGVFDRWSWLRTRLPRTRNRKTVIDLGCGSGALSIGAALRGYDVLGLSWDERERRVANERAAICGAHSAQFEVFDVRRLAVRQDFHERFDVAICFEVIEHILDDKTLIQDMARCLKPGGRLLLTTPYLFYRPISPTDDGPWSTIEDGGHVRRGYTAAMLGELCAHAGLISERISYGTGFVSQKVTYIQRVFGRIHPVVGWAVAFPFRILQVLDRPVTGMLGWPYYAIQLEAHKPRLE